MTSPAIHADRLSRVYSSRKGFFFQEVVRTEALREVSFDVQRGEMFGLLGPNGAGKTTLAKILSTLLLPTGGKAEVLGLDVARDSVRLRSRIGLVLGGERGLYYRVSGRENLRYFANLYGLEPNDLEGRIDESLARVGLLDAADRRVEEYSRGMKQKLHLARGLLHHPELLFLDEPTIGLDPRSAREMRKFIRGLRAEGVTIFLTTHYMFEAEELCDRVAVLSRGRLVALDTTAALRRLVGGDRTFEIDGYGFDDAEIARLRMTPGISKVATEEFGPRLRITLRIRDPVLPLETVAAALPGHPELETRERRTALEDIYLDLVEEDAI